MTSEQEIIKNTREFAKNNDIPYDEMTESMILNAIRECYTKSRIIERSEKMLLLGRYNDFLLKNGYADTDIICEEPFAIDEFMKTENP